MKNWRFDFYPVAFVFGVGLLFTKAWPLGCVVMVGALRFYPSKASSRLPVR